MAPMNRRNFIKRTGTYGALSMITFSGIPEILNAFSSTIPDIAISEGTNLYDNTLQCINNLGGMSKFVSKTDVVGILINASFDKEGAYVNPDIPLAVIEECFNAGAKDVILLQTIPEDYWSRTPLGPKKSEFIDILRIVKSNTFPATYNDEDYMLMKRVKGAKILKDIEVLKALFECDVFINIPIAKHHGTTLVTGALKNMMGVLTRASNVTFHLGSGERNNPEYLGQCIADLNLVRKPDLIVMDASVIMVTNGPSGPGEIERFDNVLAGTDPVAMDVLASDYVGYSPEDIVPTIKAANLGIGSMDVKNMEILKTLGS
jgi:uncharacterized protein (DUF362 family)